MKKIPIIISILFFSILINAQNNKSFFVVETFDTGIPATWTVNNTGSGTLPGWYWTENSERAPYFSNFVMINSNDNTPHVGETEGELITPGFDASSATSVILEFDHRYNDYENTPGADSAQIDVWDGSQWQNVVVYLEDHGTEDEPEHAVFDITEYKNSEMKIRFFYADEWWDWYWCVDNIVVSDPLAHDLGVVDIAPTHLYLGTKARYFPEIKIHNYGQETETTFDVEVVINNGATDVYSSVKILDDAGLSPNSEMIVTMDDLWTITENSNFTITATVILESDEYPDNDVLISACIITGVSYDEQAYGIINNPSGDDFFSSIDLSTGNYETIGQDIDMTFFPDAAEFADGVLYRCRNGINIIYFVAQDGTETELGEITGTEHSIADMTFDENAGIMYFLTNTFSPNASYLHILNMQTFELSEIGKINDGVIVTIELAGDGFIYGIDIADENIWKINKETASGTIAGSVGFDANYDQSLSYDKTTGTMYAALFEYEPTSQLGYAKFCTIDLSSGGITIINEDYEFGHQICAFAVLPSSPTSITNTAKNNLFNIYPNPSNGVFTIENLTGFHPARAGLLGLEITDITGKTILTIAQAQAQEHAPVPSVSLPLQIDISGATGHAPLPGIYFIKIIYAERSRSKTETNIYTKKLIIR